MLFVGLTLVCYCFTATLSKMIREFMPSEVRLAGDAMDMIIECCTGWCLSEVFVLKEDRLEGDN